MGWNFRKSVNLGGGLRLNFSKSGVGISGGVKGFRVSSGPRGRRVSASIPGTGLYYTKSLGKGKGGSKTRRTTNTRAAVNTNAGNNYQYSQVVTNQYTGETRELRARTQFELNQLVQTEQARQAVNEQRQKQLEAAQGKMQQVATMNQQLFSVKNELSKIIDHTLGVNDRIDWDSQMIMTEFPPFKFNEQSPIRQRQYRLPFFKSLFMNEKKFNIPEGENEAVVQFEARRNAAIGEYLIKKAEFEREKNRKNGEMVYLRKRFEESDKEAIERYISIVLTRSQYPADFEHDFDVKYDKEKKQIRVEYLFQNIDSFPMVVRYEYNERKDSINEIPMEKEEAVKFYSDILYSVGIRTIHEIFESVYTDSVDSVCFNGYIEEDDGHSCVFALKVSREVFEKVDLTKSIDSILGFLEMRTIGDFTKSEYITPFE